jgi:phosphate-selective porin OprO and OprP
VDLLKCILVGACLAGSASASAQEPSDEALRAQQAEIAALRARLEALEQNQAVDHAHLEQVRAGMAPIAPQLVPPGPATAPVDTARAAAVPSPSPQGTGLRVEWGAGAPIFRSADGVFSFKPRGRILLDASDSRGSRYAPRNVTTTGSRALRLGIEGGVGPHLFYQFESDFAENGVDVVTAFLGWRHQVMGLDYDLRMGNLFNDRGMEGSTGSDATPFLERTVVATAILPRRGFYGVGAQGRLFGSSWHASLTLTGDDVDSAYAVSDSRTVLARAHWNPVKRERTALHLGAWGFDEALASDADTATRNTVIGGRFNGNLRVSTGTLTGATGGIGHGVELGGYWRSLWALAEAGRRTVYLGTAPKVLSEAWSITVGGFVTGETPPYNPRFGNFTQPQVRRSILEGGPGAIELLARCEKLVFRQEAPLGDGWAATLGVNWYLNNFTRLMLNVISWHTDNRGGDFSGVDAGETVSLRAQVSY